MPRLCVHLLDFRELVRVRRLLAISERIDLYLWSDGLSLTPVAIARLRALSGTSPEYNNHSNGRLVNS